MGFYTGTAAEVVMVLALSFVQWRIVILAN